MTKKNIIPTISVLIALACVVPFLLKWNPEAFFRSKEPPVTMSDIEQGGVEDFTGAAAGEDIPRLTGAEDFSEILNYADYVTAEPVGIVPTGVYSLKPWVSHYSYTSRRTAGGRRREVSTSALDIEGNYHQYYLLELPDHTYILAQIPQTEVNAIEKGEKVTLPIGQKIGMSDTARKHLSAICEEYEAEMNGVFYAFDNEWQEEHHFTIFLLRFGAAALLWIVLAVGLTLLGNEIFLNRRGRT